MLNHVDVCRVRSDVLRSFGLRQLDENPWKVTSYDGHSFHRRSSWKFGDLCFSVHLMWGREGSNKKKVDMKDCGETMLLCRAEASGQRIECLDLVERKSFL